MCNAIPQTIDLQIAILANVNSNVKMQCYMVTCTILLDMYINVFDIA